VEVDLRGMSVGGGDCCGGGWRGEMSFGKGIWRELSGGVVLMRRREGRGMERMRGCRIEGGKAR